MLAIKSVWAQNNNCSALYPSPKTSLESTALGFLCEFGGYRFLHLSNYWSDLPIEWQAFDLHDIVYRTICRVSNNQNFLHSFFIRSSSPHKTQSGDVTITFRDSLAAHTMVPYCLWKHERPQRVETRNRF